MTIRGLVAMAAVAGSSLWADETRGPMQSSVTVCIEGGFPAIVGHARDVVSQMFAGIDVQIDWRWRKCPADSIRISLRVFTRANEQPGALAYALPYEGKHIVIFYDRVRTEVEPSRVPALLAHVIAHEIGHILEGVNSHSKSGVMKARWSADDYLDMAWKPLPFAPEDVFLIHRGLEQRAKHNNRTW